MRLPHGARFNAATVGVDGRIDSAVEGVDAATKGGTCVGRARRDHSRECPRSAEYRGRQGRWDESRNGGQMTHALSDAATRRVARCSTSRGATNYYGRRRRPGDSEDLGGTFARGGSHSLEHTHHAASGRRDPDGGRASGTPMACSGIGKRPSSSLRIRCSLTGSATSSGYTSNPRSARWCSASTRNPSAGSRSRRPLLPLRPGQPERRTHDYVGHGTTSLFAALDVATGKVITRCQPRHRAIELRRFLQTIDETVPADLDVHLVLDNLSTHKATTVKRWLAQHRRYNLHFTPTSASWLNQM